jgi:hypothetical protein
LTVVQTAGIIVALAITLYFSRRQARAFAVDLETRVSTDIDQKFSRIVDIFLARPELFRSIYQSGEGFTTDVALAYSLCGFCAHIYHMRQRGVLAENEWSGWLQWMKNAVRFGTIGTSWKEAGLESWFDPAFSRFVNEVLIDGIAGKH